MECDRPKADLEIRLEADNGAPREARRWKVVWALLGAD
jgi:hypothetical protein